jgi:hypothetical protein
MGEEKIVNRTILIAFGIIFLFIAVQLVWKFAENYRLNTCIEGCFYKETEIWCEMGCWSLFDTYNVNISDFKLPTECEQWGGKYPFLCTRE